MPTQAEYKPVEDTVQKVDGAVAVGEDLEVQQRWWRFERIVWSFFILILLADLSGLLGRGPLSKAEQHASDGTLDLKYEKIERANTASIITVLPGASAIHNGKFRLFVSDIVVKDLGAQRVIPQPETSVIGDGGITYTFAASALPMTVQIELKPSFVGMHHFTVYAPGGESLHAKAFVLP